MSLLLDALNKADQERKRQTASPSIDAQHEELLTAEAGARHLSKGLFIFTGFFLLMILCWFWYKHLEQVQNALKISAPIAVTSLTQSSVVISSAPVESASTFSTPEVINTPTEKSPTSDENMDEHIASLYQKNASSAATSETTDAFPAITPNTLAGVLSINELSQIPELHELPAEVLSRVPSFKYTEHHYDNYGGSVKINGELKYPNYRIGDDVIIDRILEDGIVLHIDGYSFKVRALNNWVNM